jgi:hypothetical protein
MERTRSITGEASSQRYPLNDTMKTEDRYLKFVRWSEEAAAYVGFCPDLFPRGGVCAGVDEEEMYSRVRCARLLACCHGAVSVVFQ